MAPTRETVRPELLDETEAADYISLSVFYLRQDRWRGRIGAANPGPPFLRLGRTIRYSRADLDAWLEARRVDRGPEVRRGAAKQRGPSGTGSGGKPASSPQRRVRAAAPPGFAPRVFGPVHTYDALPEELVEDARDLEQKSRKPT